MQLVPDMREQGTDGDSEEGDNTASCRRPVLQPLENVCQVGDERRDRVRHQNAENEVHVVPCMPAPDDKTGDDAHSGSAFSQQLLHQLDALQEGINFIDHQME